MYLERGHPFAILDVCGLNAISPRPHYQFGMSYLQRVLLFDPLLTKPSISA